MIEIDKEGQEYVLTINDPELKKRPKELRFSNFEKLWYWILQEAKEHFKEVEDGIH